MRDEEAPAEGGWEGAYWDNTVSKGVQMTSVGRAGPNRVKSNIYRD
jgi:hypothetical protein